jgi:hypothetical protein
MRLSSAHVVSLVLAATASGQTTVWVDVNATPPGNGTPASPYTSIQCAIDQPSTPINAHVMVRPGTYDESVDLRDKFLVVRSTHGPLATTIRASDPHFAVRSSPPFFGTTSWIEGFTVTGATAPGGSGILSPLHATTNARRCIVTGNTIGGWNEYDLFFFECTLVDNQVGLSLEDGGISLFENSIVWKNGTDVAINGPMTVLVVNYSAGLTGVLPGGQGNLVGDPGLWDDERGDWRLRPGSPCIDGGNPNAPHDPDGSRIDIGALTYDPTYAPPPVAYCTAKPNSQGCLPAISASGQASATSPLAFDVVGSGIVESKPGLLFYGYGSWALPFHGAWHCVALPTRRTPPQFAGTTGVPCSGVLGFDFNTRIQSGVDAKLQPGTLVYCQWWYRDFQDPAGFASGLTDALRFGIAP